MNNTCEICGEASKYKCPRCFIHYCSVSCCREHKKESCEDKNAQKKDEEDKKPQNKSVVSGRSGISAEKLQLLETDEEINKLLSNKHLRDLLRNIDKTENAEQIMHEAMQEPIFVEFADACLRVVDPETEDR